MGQSAASPGFSSAFHLEPLAHQQPQLAEEVSIFSMGRYFSSLRIIKIKATNAQGNTNYDFNLLKLNIFAYVLAYIYRKHNLKKEFGPLE